MCVCVYVCVYVFIGNPFGTIVIIIDTDNHTFDLPGVQRVEGTGWHEPNF